LWPRPSGVADYRISHRRYRRPPKRPNASETPPLSPPSFSFSSSCYHPISIRCRSGAEGGLREATAAARRGEPDEGEFRPPALYHRRLYNLRHLAFEKSMEDNNRQRSNNGCGSISFQSINLSSPAVSGHDNINNNLSGSLTFHINHTNLNLNHCLIVYYFWNFNHSSNKLITHGISTSDIMFKDEIFNISPQFWASALQTKPFNGNKI